MRQTFVLSRIVLLVSLLTSAVALGQPRVQVVAPPGTGRDGLKTIVDVDIIIPTVGAGAEVQDWGRFFQGLGISAQLRQGTRDERPSTTETVRGTLRTVVVLGRLDPRGTVFFADRKFTTADREKVKEWLDELKVYGAQGTPEGKPTWGLDKAQFDKLFEALSVATTATFAGVPLRTALASEEWKTDYPVRIHTSAEDRVGSPTDSPNIRVAPAGLTRGTALAAILADAGLGFRPQRTPAGTIELTILPLESLRDPWPVGWPLDPVQPRNQIAPTYFANGQVDFEQVPLKTVLEACSERARIPILIDYPRCEAKKIDPAKVLVSHPKKKLAYALVVNTVVHQARLSLSLKSDEKGQPFVHVYPFKPKPLNEP